MNEGTFYTGRLRVKLTSRYINSIPQMFRLLRHEFGQLWTRGLKPSFLLKLVVQNDLFVCRHKRPFLFLSQVKDVFQGNAPMLHRAEINQLHCCNSRSDE